jgi:putative membrane protein
MHWLYDSPMGWGMFGLMMMLAWGGLIVVTLVLVRRQPNGTRTSSATRILEERLAKGEIDSAEFGRLRGIIDSR